MIFDLHCIDPPRLASSCPAVIGQGDSRISCNYLSDSSCFVFNRKYDASPAAADISNIPAEPSTSSRPTSSRKKRKKKMHLKLEMCESILKGIDCNFGSKCTFAHNESELQLTTLREREDAGLVDIMTFRTRPCLDHVMTGSW